MSVFDLPQPKWFNITNPAEHVAHVEINRPQKLNAFFNPMWYELRGIFKHLSSHPDVRCILISGAGDRAFTAGLDVQAASSDGGALLNNTFIDPSRRAAFLRRHILDLQDVISTVANCEKPVIALMHGYSYGLAIDLSSACDVRFCTNDTKFCIKEIDIGLAPDVGTLSRLPKVMGGLTSFAKEVALSARPFSAEEALQNHFVSKVVGSKEQLIQEGYKLAQLIASKSPVAVQGSKNILDAAWGRTVEENLNYTAVWNMGMLQSTDTERAMLSGLQKRQPKFEKL